jgi:hypothetical protein
MPFRRSSSADGLRARCNASHSRRTSGRSSSSRRSSSQISWCTRVASARSTTTASITPNAARSNAMIRASVIVRIPADRRNGRRHVDD